MKVTIFLTNMTHISTIVALRRQHLSEPYPADSLVEVRAVSRPELELAIEAFAIRRSHEPAGD